MKHLFDSSAIFKAIKENKIELLNGNNTVELARYELGNIIWKDQFLQEKISPQEAKMTIKTINHALNIMKIIETAGEEEAILDTAIKLGITFYDASYAHIAKVKNLKLITEDNRLIRKITPTVNASTIDSIKL